MDIFAGIGRVYWSVVYGSTVAAGVALYMMVPMLAPVDPFAFVVSGAGLAMVAVGVGLAPFVIAAYLILSLLNLRRD